MPVAESILPKIYSIFNEYKNSKDEDTFTNKYRKEIKIIVDTLFEQIIESILDQKPRNALNARLAINKTDLSAYSSSDRKLLNSLKNVLVEYDSLNSKEYIDHSESLIDFVSNELYALSIALINHEKLSQCDNAQSLKNYLIEYFEI